MRLEGRRIVKLICSRALWDGKQHFSLLCSTPSWRKSYGGIHSTVVNFVGQRIVPTKSDVVLHAELIYVQLLECSLVRRGRDKEQVQRRPRAIETTRNL